MNKFYNPFSIYLDHHLLKEIAKLELDILLEATKAKEAQMYNEIAKNPSIANVKQKAHPIKADYEKIKSEYEKVKKEIQKIKEHNPGNRILK